MPTSPVAVVSDDAPLAEALQHQLRTRFGAPSLLRSFTTIRSHLGPNTRGLLVLGITTAQDTDQAIRLVRDVCLRQWPVDVILAEREEVEEQGLDERLDRLDPYVRGRFRWPAQALGLEELIQSVQREVGRPGPSLQNGERRPLPEQLLRELLSQTPSLARMAEPLAVAAQHDVTVLLTGETGTGKTHLAHLIHQHSPRKQQRLLVVPCGALPASLIESELFGHARGAFTGADRAKVGKFEAAGEGTILLDEIDALGLEQQVKLLRVLETGAFEPVGSNDTRSCKARIIVASNLDLEEAITLGTFREDLYYRLNVLAFHLPPLHERPEDIRPLARAMVASFVEKFNKEVFGVSDDALHALAAFPWPGNIRQLQNALQQAVLVCTGPELLRSHLPEPIREYAAPELPPPPPPTAAAGSLAEHRELQERQAIERALAEAQGCRSDAARALGVSRVTLYNKMKKYGIPTRQQDGINC